MPQLSTELKVDRSLFRRAVPAWLLSFILHASLLIVAALCWQAAPRGVEEPARGVGIVLSQTSAAGTTEYFDDAGAAGSPGRNGAAAAAASEAIDSTTSPNAIPLPGSQPLPSTSGPQLPTQVSELGAPGDFGLPGTTGDFPGTGGLTPGTGRGDQGAEGKGTATLNVFGVQGTGSRFIYVFDRSLSMSGFQGRPLAAAKAELIASLQSLGDVHQFQIIFYNEEPQVFNTPGSKAPRLVFGGEEGRRKAAAFVNSITAAGGTQHMDALLKALAMNPDVVFFLTDADDPKLSDADLSRIRQRNRNGAVINCIEYGAGVSQNSNSFLKRLAAQNRGQHVYIDITRLPHQK